MAGTASGASMAASRALLAIGLWLFGGCGAEGSGGIASSRNIGELSGAELETLCEQQAERVREQEGQLRASCLVRSSFFDQETCEQARAYCVESPLPPVEVECGNPAPEAIVCDATVGELFECAAERSATFDELLPSWRCQEGENDILDIVAVGDSRRSDACAATSAACPIGLSLTVVGLSPPTPASCREQAVPASLDGACRECLCARDDFAGTRCDDACWAFLECAAGCGADVACADGCAPSGSRPNYASDLIDLMRFDCAEACTGVPTVCDGGDFGGAPVACGECACAQCTASVEGCKTPACWMAVGCVVGCLGSSFDASAFASCVRDTCEPQHSADDVSSGMSLIQGCFANACADACDPW